LSDVTPTRPSGLVAWLPVGTPYLVPGLADGATSGPAVGTDRTHPATLGSPF